MLDRKLCVKSIFRSLILPVLVLLCMSVSTTTHATDTANKVATIHTSKGEIQFELYTAQAPLTVANFVQYIEDSAFKGGDFYRVVRADNDQGNPKIAVIQGRANPQHQDFSPVHLETTALTGLLHLDGTLSMARGDPDTATNEFFICIGPQPALDFGGKRNPDGQGFAAFGRVIKGMEIVKSIQQTRQAVEVEDAYVVGQILAHPVTIIDVTFANNN